MERAELIDAFKECSAILSAIGDENRQRMLIALIENPGLRVEEIKEYTNLSRPAVSHHLKVLKDANAITVLRVGTKNFYFPSCECNIWKKLNSLTERICTLADEIMKYDLEVRRREIVNEHDD